MSIIRSFMNRIGYQPITLQRRQRSNTAARSFIAAEMNRLTADLSTSATHIDRDIYSQGSALRTRARQTVLNNDYAKRWLELFINNVVGPTGHTFESNVTEMQLIDNKYKRVPDKVANTKIFESFTEWTRAQHCSVDGRLNYSDLSKLLATYYARDGEAFLRRVYNKKSKYFLQLQIIPPESVDENYNTIMSNGNVVIMGVELDQWRRPVNYYVKKIMPELQIYGVNPYGGDHEIIPASEILHWYKPEYSNQTRGYTRMASALLHLHWLKGYETAAVLNARLSAAKMGFFGDDKEESSTEEEIQADDQDTDENMIIDAEPGSFNDIGKKKFFGWDPTYPTAQHEMFIRATLRGAASGLGVAYSSLSNDYSQANYSSMRSELLVENRMWMGEQNAMIVNLHEKIFTWWLEAALLSGSLLLPFEKINKFNAPVFMGPGFRYVDPLKDVQATRQEIECCLSSPFDAALERGKNLEQIYRDIAEARDLAEQYGLKPIYGTGKSEPAPEPPAKEPAVDDEVDIAAALARPTNGKN